MSNDPEQEYFCDGITEDVITELSRFDSVFVISRNSAFTFKNVAVDTKTAARELQVQYVLEGSVRKLGKRIRISTSLISCERENTVWSDNFDTTLDEIFDVQDDLVQKIVYTIVGRVEADSVKQLTAKPPDNRTAYDLVLQGLEHHRKAGVDKEHAEQAVKLFEQAIEVDANYARAYAWRACSLSWNGDWFPERYKPNEVFELCTQSASKALELDPNDHEAHRIMGSISLENRDYEKARLHHARAVELCPSDAYILGKNAATLIYYGEPEEALESVQKAVRINPFCPDDLLLDEGLCHYWMGNFEESIESFQKIKMKGRNSLSYLAVAYASLRKIDKAKEVLEQIALRSRDSVETFFKNESYKDHTRNDKLLSVLEKIPT